MKALLAILVSAMTSLGICAQIRVETGIFTNWYVDNHGNAFVQSDNRIQKINSSGEIVARWSSSKSNKITSFDARDHLRVLVFYQEAYQISILDKNLIEITKPIDLQSSGLNDIVVMCQAVNGGFWVADRQTNTVYALHNNLSTNYSFSFARFGTVSEIRKITEFNQQLWFLMEDNSWLVLDAFGQFAGRHSEPGLEKAQISKQVVHLLHEGKLFSYNTITKEKEDSKRFFSEHVSCFAYKNLLFLMSLGNITIWPVVP